MATLQFTEGDVQRPCFAGAAKQLLPNVIDGLANTRPGALYAMIPNSFTTYEAGFRKVTYRQLASAVNGAAQFLSGELGSGSKSQVLAYVAPNDIGYICFLLGAVKAGHKLLLLSPRNTKDDLASIFKTTDCATLLTLPQPYSPTVTNILEAVEQTPRVIHVPTIYQLLETHYPHFPYPKTFETAKHETLVIVHTSGTTNTPKAGAIQLALFDAVMNQSVMVTALAAVPPSAQGIVDALEHVDVEVIHMVAPFMEQMAKRPDMLDIVLPKVKGVTYGGADVSEAAANAFLAKVHVAGFNGSTESAPYPVLRPRDGWNPADLKYIQPHPTANFQFRATAMPDLFEGVIVRNQDPEHTQPVFHAYPDLDEFNTKDLFSPHPTKPGLWLYRGRADDMIVSAAGEMCNPVPFEQDVARSPQITEVLMVGAGRYQKALLVEPADMERHTGSAAEQAFIDSIWPTIAARNQKTSPVDHIARTHVLLTKPDMPLKRAGKGTVQRAPSLTLYQSLIDEFYRAVGDGTGRTAEPYDVHVPASEPGRSTPS
nr:non-canonical non-ribosomal peptide synthetase fub8 [Quercus suber]